MIQARAAKILSQTARRSRPAVSYLLIDCNVGYLNFRYDFLDIITLWGDGAGTPGKMLCVSLLNGYDIMPTVT